MSVQEVRDSQQQPNNNTIEKQDVTIIEEYDILLIAIPPDPGRLSSLLQDVQLVNEYS